MSSLDKMLLERAHRLVEFAEPKINWCGTENCLHRMYEHGLNNRCIVCVCPSFSQRKPVEDLTTALKFLL